ncbi:hypothetical protein V1264_022634 [Littorina saxatilis]|uniref:Kazal-like domain-containing protein n=1 Tax=Littorina saxatilis TaxID=31220 RepID=A0AAN9AKR2_9CAEN
MLFVFIVFIALISVGSGQDDPYDPDFVLDYFCRELSHHPCTFPTRHICASDGRTYNNLCEYQKARCVFREINFVDFKPCAAT